MSLWKCKCGVLNSEEKEECAYCDMPRDPEAFDGVNAEDETKIIPPVKEKTEDKE